ncbi:U7 snRNA-associated Sm-like protein LSm11 [Eucyclogobius newberryi]|uniref:U7 snRNA-associated Sm-like protein LSm11 n=1 Tax=Eucyclogobius newberryi TaxID=166745 RepID=UPI003B5B7134
MEESERKERTHDTKEPKTTPGLDPQDAESESNVGDETDVCSERFNPLLALYSPTVKLPFPSAKCLNNVAAYESALKGSRGRGAKPENVEKRRRKAMKGVVDQERIERLKKLMVNNPVTESEQGESSGTQRRRKSKPVKNVLTRMPLCQGGPLGELYRFIQERIRVRVHIRTFKGLRGVCSGFIVAFDRFWNMAMVDVDETYREPLLGQALYHEKALTVTRLFEKLKLQENFDAEEATRTGKIQVKDTEPQSTTSKGKSPADSKEKVPQKYGKVHTRHINQLFIRGENVVLVSPQTLS